MSNIIEENKELFQCPDTHEELLYVSKGTDEGEFVNKFETRFQTSKNFIDFVGVKSSKRVTQKRKDSKEKTFADIYDHYMETQDWMTGMIDSVIWGHKLQSGMFTQAMKVFLTELQQGTILDFPVITGLVSTPVYRDFHQMKFVSADYAVENLSAAFDRLYGLHVNNSILLQADPRKLPLKDEIFEGVSSLCGLNFVKDFREFFKEVHRVMKQGGKYIGTAYVKGEKQMADNVIEKLIISKGYFPSVLTRGELQKALKEAGFDNISLAQFESDSIMRFSADKS